MDLSVHPALMSTGLAGRGFSAVRERLHSGAGLADPGPIASALWVDTELHSSVCLDSIVTVVDAHNLKKQLRESGSHDSTNEAERQIAFADTILLNKVRPANFLTFQPQTESTPRTCLDGTLPHASANAYGEQHLTCFSSARRSFFCPNAV